MQRKYERGELSLIWCFVLIMLVTGIVMMSLFSMRYERNFFAEAWSRFQHTVGLSQMPRTLQHAQETAVSISKPGSAAVRKCMIGGRVMYSNVDCGPENPTSRKVELQDSRGIDPPKAAASVAASADVMPDMKNKMIVDSF